MSTFRLVSFYAPTPLKFHVNRSSGATLDVYLYMSLHTLITYKLEGPTSCAQG
jgi:hypothetical protein